MIKWLIIALLALNIYCHADGIDKKGTTTQRPSAPRTGFLYYNTTLDSLQVYTGSGWWNIATSGQITPHRYHITYRADFQTGITEYELSSGDPNLDLSASGAWRRLSEEPFPIRFNSVLEEVVISTRIVNDTPSEVDTIRCIIEKELKNQAGTTTEDTLYFIWQPGEQDTLRWIALPMNTSFEKGDAIYSVRLTHFSTLSDFVAVEPFIVLYFKEE